jgi:hypothetical protein
MRFVILLGLMACADPVDGDNNQGLGDTDAAADSDDSVSGDCDYAANAVDPMELDEVITSYSWPTALRADGTDFPIDLTSVFCASDPNLEWSPFDALLFVSIPAW